MRIVASLAVLLQVACTPPTAVPDATPDVAPAIRAPIASVAPGTCRERAEGLADPSCTPGAIDPRVTQANLSTTICRVGYTATVRPPTSITEPIKRERLSAYGHPSDATTMQFYELDHLIPLELGGAPSDIANLWPEPWSGPSGAHVKDPVENDAKRAVCDGSMMLDDAQQSMATNWKILGHRLGVVGL